MPPRRNSKLLKVQEAAEELGVHENTLRRWARDGYIASVKHPSGVRRFRSEDVERLRATMNEDIVENEGFSITGAEGASAVATLLRLATGELSFSNLDDDRYGLEPDGSLRLEIDDESFELLVALPSANVTQ